MSSEAAIKAKPLADFHSASLPQEQYLCAEISFTFSINCIKHLRSVIYTAPSNKEILSIPMTPVCKTII